MERKSFYHIGIAVRTTNENSKAMTDIGQLWERFFKEDLASKIPNKTKAGITCLYTDYEGDFMKPYTCILGMQVENLDEIPEGMVGTNVNGGHFKAFETKADQVGAKWGDIWQTDLNRNYDCDYEIYDPAGQTPSEIDVGIHIGLET